MEREDGFQSRNYKSSFTSPPTLRRVSPMSTECRASVPRLGNIWVPKSTPSTNHFPRFYIRGVEDMFQVGDRIIRVEHGGMRSQMISWRVWRDIEQKWQF